MTINWSMNNVRFVYREIWTSPYIQIARPLVIERVMEADTNLLVALSESDVSTHAI